jgi:hypothetical protein
MKWKTTSRPLWQVALVAVLGLLATNALAFFAFTLPRLNRSRRAEDQVATLRQLLVSERAEADRLRKRARAIEANIRDSKRFLSETIRPMSEALAADLDVVEGAVRTSGLGVEQRGYSQQAVTGAPLLRYSIHLPLSGPRSQAGALLRELERVSRFVIIDRVGLRDDRDVGQVRFDLDLSTYYQNDAAAPRKAADKRAVVATKGARRP